MTVSIVGISKRDPISLDMTNNTWFTVLRDTDVGKILNVSSLTNDPIRATASQSKKCAMALIGFKPDDNWFKCDGFSKHEFLLELLEFFKDCGQMSGFRTY